MSWAAGWKSVHNTCLSRCHQPPERKLLVDLAIAPDLVVSMCDLLRTSGKALFLPASHHSLYGLYGKLEKAHIYIIT